MVAVALLASGCAKKKPKVAVPVSTRPVLPSVVGATEVGVASWYGHPYHGRRTANGEVYDQEAMTAAHPTLAFNTWVRVDNLDNGLDTRVRINDRGPFVKDRAIDLSRAAARAIAMLGPGTANVRVVVISTPDRPAGDSMQAAPGPPPAGQPAPSISPRPPMPAATQRADSASQVQGWAVQFGAFQSMENALRLRDQVAAFLPDARVVASPASPSLWLVLAGESLTREAVEQIVHRFRDDFPRIFPVPAH